MATRTVRNFGRPWRRIRAAVLAESTICHICGGPGADSVDHIIPVALRPDLEFSRSNLAPAHYKVPPYCNRKKGDRPMVPGVIRRSGSLAPPQGTPRDSDQAWG